MYFGGKPVKAGLVRMVAGCVSAVLLAFLLLLGPSLLAADYPRQTQAVSAIDVHSAEDLLIQLKANNLWDVPEAGEISPLVVKRFPRDMPRLDSATQKKAFLHTLLPAAMVALAEVEEEKAAFEGVMAKLPGRSGDLAFLSAGGAVRAKHGLDQAEIAFLENLCRKYRTTDAADLRRRINPVPISLIMAQGALESGWGSSRMALERNNLFGVLNWEPENSAEPVAARAYSGVSYASLLDSVRAYLLMINRSPAYNRLRSIREESMDSLALVKGLHKYSERGDDYLADLVVMIRSNELRAYDQCVLAGREEPGGKFRLAGGFLGLI